MYRINDKSSAIESIQRYLRVVGNQDIFVAPIGVYDENTRLSVLDFQEKNGLTVSGTVDIFTFDKLFHQYLLISERNNIREKYDSFITFPLLPGQFVDAMIHINRTLSRLLDYYGETHNLRESNFYSQNTADAVKRLRRIYLLEDKNLIDEELYGIMINDHDSIFESQNIFN